MPFLPRIWANSQCKTGASLKLSALAQTKSYKINFFTKVLYIHRHSKKQVVEVTDTNVVYFGTPYCAQCFAPLTLHTVLPQCAVCCVLPQAVAHRRCRICRWLQRVQAVKVMIKYRTVQCSAVQCSVSSDIVRHGPPQQIGIQLFPVWRSSLPVRLYPAAGQLPGLNDQSERQIVS
jgi:hypothetical protein